MIRKLLLAVCATALTTSAADAKIVTVTYSGLVGDAADGLHLFGDGSSLTGAAFVANYRFDTSLGASLNFPHSGGAVGGTSNGEPTPSLGASIKINGHTVSLAGSSLAEIQNYQSAVYSAQFSSVEDSGAGFSYAFQNSAIGYGAYDFGSPSLADWSGDIAGLGDNGYLNFRTDISSDTYVSSYLRLNADHLTITSGPVPEPAAWTMMVGGFALIGRALRRRKAALRVD